MNHTKEPWELKKIDTEEYEYIGPLSGSGQIGIDSIFCREEDAKRVIACVNACAGISTEDLEKTPKFSKLMVNYLAGGDVTKFSLAAALSAASISAIEYESQRDELLAALKLCKFDSLNMSLDDMRKISLALAKAEQSK